MDQLTFKTRVRHLRNEKGRPWATLVIIENEKFTIAAASSCHKRDCFSKKIGRHIAESRAAKALNQKLSGLNVKENPMVMILDRPLAEHEYFKVDTIYHETEEVTTDDKRNLFAALGLDLDVQETEPTPVRSIVLKTRTPE